MTQCRPKDANQKVTTHMYIMCMYVHVFNKIQSNVFFVRPSPRHYNEITDYNFNILNDLLSVIFRSQSLTCWKTHIDNDQNKYFYIFKCNSFKYIHIPKYTFLKLSQKYAR